MDTLEGKIESLPRAESPSPKLGTLLKNNILKLLPRLGFDLLIMMAMAMALGVLAKSVQSPITWFSPSLILPLSIMGGVLFLEFVKWFYYRFTDKIQKARYLILKIPIILRDWTPFILIDFIYENLHSLSTKLNYHDIAESLFQFDIWLFGVEPTLWFQNITHPILTDVMAIFYAPYLAYPMLFMALFTLTDRRQGFRQVSLAIIFTFILGFVLYVIFPANPPRFHIEHLYTDPVRLTGSFIHYHLQGVWDDLSAVRGAAFPSLHTAISTVALYFAYQSRNLSLGFRIIWYLYIPLISGLWISTIYLRHHWVLDLVGGWIVAALAIVIANYLLKLQSRLYKASIKTS